MLKVLPKVIITAVIFSYYIFVSSFAYGTYDPASAANNKFGIHLLFPSELEEAARLVNSANGEWGYITIPIRSDDHNLEKWQVFMDKAKILKLIPILRLATYPEGDSWAKPTIFDPLDWANFLSSLEWPTKNRYVIIYNEPNRAEEWGREINPSDYSAQLKQTSLALKRLNDDFFVLPAGFDASAPNNHVLMDEYSFLTLMHQADNEIFKYIDGWTSHAYPNPNFRSPPAYLGRNGITSYQWELAFLQKEFGVSGLKVFITETGWDGSYLNPNLVAAYFKEAFATVWNQDYIVAVTPFLLGAGEGAFKKFSWTSQDSYQPLPVYETVQKMNKIKGEPKINTLFEQNAKLKEEKSIWSAQKTGFWHQTTISWIKKTINWLFH
ncbi:hypothetical protein HY030_03480 [Candidatus Gottesmanbacteria bacterium]|nr:hypothetical protein [Candidatus Gottesmanbacteria bacterium]